MQDAGSSAPAAPPQPVTIEARFQQYSLELDEHYDRRERIVKTSRDVTALSKKLIFHLHRITQRKPAAILNEAKPKLEELRNLLASLQQDLEGERYWRCGRHRRKQGSSFSLPSMS